MARRASDRDVARSIARSLSRFLAILAITGLGAGFFAGLRMTAPDMRVTVDRYLDDTAFMDVHLVSTLGFSQADVDAVRAVRGVRAVMPGDVSDVSATIGERRETVRVHGIDTTAAASSDISSGRSAVSKDEDYLNRPILVAGRWPERSGECVLDRNTVFANEAQLGQRVVFTDAAAELTATFAQTGFEVVGIADSSYYLAFTRGTTSLNDGNLDRFMYVPEGDFTEPDVYSDLFVTVEGARGLLAFSQGYEDVVAEAVSSLEAIAPEREEARLAEVKEEAQAELDEERADYDEARREADSELAKAERDIDDAAAKIARSERDLARGEREYRRGVSELAAEREAFEAQVAQAPPEVAAAMRAQAEARFDAAERDLAAAKRRLRSGRAELAEGERELADARAEYEDAKREADTELADALEAIEDAQAEIDAIEKPEWYVLDRDANMGFASMSADADRIDAISLVFPFIFFLVAALVSLTTMTRMVDEERTLIGTYKALGYGRMRIAGKYLVYAGVAGVAGSIAGILVGSQVLPRTVWQAYTTMYTLPDMLTPIHLPIALVAGFSSVGITLAATFFAVQASLLETPANLMMPKAPKPGKRIFLERVRPVWSRLSFSQKVTARNLFRYKKRLLMTIAGISGCTALLLTGFGLRDSIADVLANQYGKIYRYDTIVGLEQPSGEETAVAGLKEGSGLREVLADETAFSGHLVVRTEGVNFSRTDGRVIEPEDSDADGAGKYHGYLRVPSDPDGLGRFIRVRERDSGEAVPLGDEGVIVTEKLAQKLGLETGDRIRAERLDAAGGSSGEEPFDFEVTGIAEQYVSHFVYVSPALYERVLGEEPVYNEVLARAAAKDTESRARLSDDLLDEQGVTIVQYTDDVIASFDDMLASLDEVVFVLIFSAGMLAFIVLYNLTNINVTERQREIATIKVLGFYDSEVNAYIYRETAILTLLGCGIGLLLGIALEAYVITTVEIDIVMFGRSIHPPSYLYSAALTLLFGLVVNIAMVPRLRGVDMVESLKSVE